MEKIIILIDEEITNRSERRKKAIENLEYNPMCYDCKSFQNGCTGSKSKVYSGCIWKEKDEKKKNIYALINESI